MRGVDYSTGPPDPPTIAGAGFQAALHYITRFDGAAKAITPAERAALHGASIGIVYEDGGGC